MCVCVCVWGGGGGGGGSRLKFEKQGQGGVKGLHVDGREGEGEVFKIRQFSWTSYLYLL